MLSDDCVNMLVKDKRYGLTSKDAMTLFLLDDGDRLEYYLDVVDKLQTIFVGQEELLNRIGRVAGNW